MEIKSLLLDTVKIMKTVFFEKDILDIFIYARNFSICQTCILSF